MKAVVVGSGAGGAIAALKLAESGFDVTILEAGKPFSPLTRHVLWLRSLRGSWLLKDASSISRFFAHYSVIRASQNLTIFRGVTEGGCTSIACGNMIRAENGLKEIGLDLSEEFQELEKALVINAIPRESWRPLTQQMFDRAKQLGYNPRPTPKAVDLDKCIGCGHCEVGCKTGAKWESRQIYKEHLGDKISLLTNSPVQRVVIEDNRARGVQVSVGRATEKVSADVVVLSAGGVGTAQILQASNLHSKENLWVDVVLTVGGTSKNSRMLNEPPMVWYAKRENHILSPYFDLLSYWFHKPWKNVGCNDRVGMMIKLADTEIGSVAADGSVTKELTEKDNKNLDIARSEAIDILEASGVEGPFVDGMIHGGHLGGTVSLTKDDVETMRPDWFPESLWVADLSLIPRSQGLPTMLTTAALSLRVAKRIIQERSRS